MYRQKQEIYLNRVLIMAIALNYSYYRVVEATTNNELTTYGILSVIAFICLVLNIILWIKSFR